MDKEKLEKGNEILRKINKYESALECFEWVPGENGGGDVISLNPKLAIEFDDWDDGREMMVLPDIISEDFIEMLKTHIETRIEELLKEFDEL